MSLLELNNFSNGIIFTFFSVALVGASQALPKFDTLSLIYRSFET